MQLQFAVNLLFPSSTVHFHDSFPAYKPQIAVFFVLRRLMLFVVVSIKVNVYVRKIASEQSKKGAKTQSE